MSELLLGKAPEQWHAFRQSYQYPSVCLVRATSGEIAHPSLQLSRDLSSADSPTGHKIEGLHRSLLLSESTEDLLHGLASTVFWGFFASANPKRKPNPKRAETRARWALQLGGGRSRPIDQASLVAKLVSARNSIRESRLADGLTAYRQIPNVGWSFASKLVMFSDPKCAAVYDSVIAEKLIILANQNPVIAECTLTSPKLLERQSKTLVPPAYEHWCNYCQKTAEILNREGLPTSWDREWWAVDVERAIFAMPED
jgi:hypothetical protein